MSPAISCSAGRAVMASLIARTSLFPTRLAARKLGPATVDLVMGTGWTEGVALLAAFLMAILATLAGISGAVLPLPEAVVRRPFVPGLCS